MALLTASAVSHAQDLAALDRLYLHRDDPNALAQLEAALAQPGDDAELLWRAARAHCAKARATDSSSIQQTEAKTCWALADQARSLNPREAEGHYWAAVGVGLFAETIGVLRAMSEGIEGKLRERIDKALSLNPTIERGGPWLFKARFLHQSPWPIRDMTRAGELYAKVVLKFPQNLTARLHRADWLWEQGERKQALEEYGAIVAADVSADPAEGRTAVSEATQRLQRLVR